MATSIKESTRKKAKRRIRRGEEPEVLKRKRRAVKRKKAGVNLDSNIRSLSGAAKRRNKRFESVFE